MPYKVRKVNGYQVTSPGGVKAKHTTFQKAQRQAALLRGVEHGWKPTGKKSKRTYAHSSPTLHGQEALKKVGAL